ncbi:MAG: hypothetical protein HKO93_00915 [Flavobacteriales bacterium]|nr:hypothetical protein [Flavobacteriales bacterium]
MGDSVKGLPSPIFIANIAAITHPKERARAYLNIRNSMAGDNKKRQFDQVFNKMNALGSQDKRFKGFGQKFIYWRERLDREWKASGRVEPGGFITDDFDPREIINNLREDG